MARLFSSIGVILLTTVAVAQDVAPKPMPATTEPRNAAADRQALEYFEKRVRPVLVEHCYGCHGPKKQEAGLRLDSAAALKKGSDSGPVIFVNELERSPLIEVVHYGGSVKMPPNGKLPDKLIEVLTTWVKAGAAWPDEVVAASSSAKKTPQELGRTHWAFQPVREPVVPSTKDRAWATSPIDDFILARLEFVGLKPSPPADRHTLIRRATFDLHGLPPTPEQVAAFETDESPRAFEKVVNRLLDSPRYGERFGRHWLDVARYSDTKGYVRLKDNPNYTSSWPYRDYVIRAFNDDLPYDQFILQQLAADQLDLGDDPSSLAAMGFLTLGQRFLNSQHDIIDDRIDVLTRGFLGLTVTCARCHDHKFDPIPTRDYYSLHGVFASSAEPRVPPLIVAPAQRPRYEAYLKELETRTARFDQFLNAQQTKLATSFRLRANDYLLAAQQEQLQANFLAVMFLVDSTKDLNPVMVQRWRRFLEQSRKQHHPVLAPWHALADLPSADFAHKAVELLAKWDKSSDVSRPINRVVRESLHTTPPKNLADVARQYGELFQAAEERWRKTLLMKSDVRQLDDPDWEAIRRLLYGQDAPLDVALADVEEFLFVDATTQNQFHEQQRLVEDWITSSGAAPHAQALIDAAVTYNPRVFLRGNASNPGDAVPRQFLEVLTRGERRPFQHGSGRLELAQAIADKQNPLTARVLVNRIWMHHFGAGIVQTPSDFGLRGEPPTHPELLDYLASRFMKDDWSIKKLHRLIMLSSVYQQVCSSALRRPLSQIVSEPPEGGTTNIDPENRFLSRMNRRRLDWESLRDAMIFVSGNLEVTMSGPSVNLTTQPFSTRRTVYGLIDRQNLPGVMRTFDFAPPDVSSPQRHQTTVPQQALFLMNSPFLKEQTRRIAARPDLLVHPEIDQRINALHRVLFGRAAEPDEVSLGKKFLDRALTSEVKQLPTADSPTHLTAWEEYVQALLLSNEFMFID